MSINPSDHESHVRKFVEHFTSAVLNEFSELPNDAKEPFSELVKGIV